MFQRLIGILLMLTFVISFTLIDSTSVAASNHHVGEEVEEDIIEEVEKLRGWVEIDEQWFYFDLETGEARTGWSLIGEKWYYFTSNGEMQVGWINLKNKWYFLDNNGAMETGWFKVGSTWYYATSDGAMQTGWVKLKNKWYYLNDSGSMRSGWFQVNSTWYYATSDGAMQTGWVKLNNKWYFLKNSGAMQIGWFMNGGNWYYSATSGAMQTGWLQIGSKWYFLNSSGAMQTDWKQVNNKWYYLFKSGQMASNTTINGYKLDKNGAWLSNQSSNIPTYIDGVLIVNKTLHLPSSYAPGESSTARTAFTQMATKAKSAGYSLTAFSTYRSYTYQSGLFDRYSKAHGVAKASRFSARAGQSEHQTGLAFDVGEVGKENQWASSSFASTNAAKWIAQNAHKYGFIIRYPEGKEHITGYIYEPWHLRYLGVDLATKVYNSNKTLEEYLGVY